jgi:glycerol-3-phosphate O-acyltransferase/dihydroxyacetone phosphate acyltransferase
MDHGGQQLDNDSAFAALHDILGRGRAAGIFPEGISHEGPQLTALKTGAARIAFGAKRATPGTPLCIVPTGLHYFNRHRFRSTVLVQFGEPIWLDDARLAAHAAGEQDAVRALTRDLDDDLRALTVNATDWDTARVLDGVRRLYQPPDARLQERVELARRFNLHYPAVKDQPEVKTLYGRVAAYLERLDAAGLDDNAVREGVGPGAALVRVLRHLLLCFVWLPLAIAGAPLHLPLYAFLKVAGKRLAPRKDVIATTKFVLGVALILPVWIALAVIAGWRFGLWTGITAALLGPLTGWAMLRVLSRAEALRRLVKTSIRVLRLGREIHDLRAERAELERLVVGAVERHKPADLEPLFPRPAAPAVSDA